MMEKVKKLVARLINKRRAKKFKAFGKTSKAAKGTYTGNIYVGDHVSIGKGAWFVASKAKINIHDYVVIAPNVTIYTGGNVTNVLGKHIIEITDADKDKSADKDRWDKDVTIESGCWIGTRAIILKGVTIGRGSVIGAGAVVTKDVPPYSIYVGSPPQRTFDRFTEQEVKTHESMLKERNMLPDSFNIDKK